MFHLLHQDRLSFAKDKKEKKLNPKEFGGGKL
jgi:hypothetical protein